MSPIDPTNPLLARLRAHAAAWRRAVPSAAEGRAPAAGRAPRATPAPAEGWLAVVAQSVLAIRRSDPDRRRKAFRIYLQALLARECGVHRVEAAGFQDLVDRVLEAMVSDPRLSGAVNAAGDVLLETAGPEQP